MRKTIFAIFALTVCSVGLMLSAANAQDTSSVCVYGYLKFDCSEGILDTGEISLYFPNKYIPLTPGMFEKQARYIDDLENCSSGFDRPQAEAACVNTVLEKASAAKHYSVVGLDEIERYEENPVEFVCFHPPCGPIFSDVPTEVPYATDNPSEIGYWLIDVENVFLGSKFLELWESKVGLPIVCGPEGHWGAYCTFVRDGPGIGDIEYCESHMVDQLLTGIHCIVVGNTANLEVLATNGFSRPGIGAGGEGEEYCEISGSSRDEVEAKVLLYFKSLSNPDVKVSHREGMTDINLAYINQWVEQEKIYARAYVWVDLYDAESGVDMVHNISISVSPRSTDSVVEYREPNNIAGARLYAIWNDDLRNYLVNAGLNYSCM